MQGPISHQTIGRLIWLPNTACSVVATGPVSGSAATGSPGRPGAGPWRWSVLAGSPAGHSAQPCRLGGLACLAAALTPHAPPRMPRGRAPPAAACPPSADLDLGRIRETP